ncbi:MAG: type II toxin-antitoxin system VapC family toxin [Magnetococcus sp. YQC-3]
MMYLFDSNPLIDLLNNALSPRGKDLVRSGIRGGAAYSVITRIEVLGYPMDYDALATAGELLGLFTEIGLTEPILRRTIALRQQHRRLKIPNAIIAATAIEFALPLVTRNTVDFSAIARLSIIDPFHDEATDGHPTEQA